MCVFAILVLFGPRLGVLFWWLLRPMYFQTVFNTWIWPLVGLIFLPWTTLMYLIVAPGGFSFFDWLLIGLAVVMDIISYGGSAYGNRNRMPGFGA